MCLRRLPVSVCVPVLWLASADFTHDTKLVVSAPDPALLSGDSPILKQQLSVAFGVDPVKLNQTLAAHKYILTVVVVGAFIGAPVLSLVPLPARICARVPVQFLMKMLHIRERRAALVPTIIEGETGVGKTKLMTVYAAIESMSYAANYNTLPVFKIGLKAGLRDPKIELIKRFVDQKVDKELGKHSLSVSRVLRACVQSIVEVAKHEQGILVKVRVCPVCVCVCMCVFVCVCL